MKRIRQFFKHERGVALIEFAIVSPFMFLLLFGGIEVSRLLLVTQKVAKASYILTDIVGQYATPTVAGTGANELNLTRLNADVFANFDRLMSPYGSNSQEMVIISSVVHKAPSSNLLRWQQMSNVGTLTTGVTSIVTGAGPKNFGRSPTTPGPGPACPATAFNASILALLNATPSNTGVGAYDGENIIVGEVFFYYQPIMSFLFDVTTQRQNYTNGPFSLQPHVIQRYIMLHPRNDKLLDLPPNSPVANTALGQVEACP